MMYWLIGYMGAGKTTIGRQISQDKNIPFVDTDTEIELLTGLTVAQLWKKHGESYFRILERQLALKLAHEFSGLVACGGGMPIHSFSIDEMKAVGKVVFLDVSIDTLWARVMSGTVRPLAIDKDDFRSIYSNRIDVYRRADVTVVWKEDTWDQHLAELLGPA